MSWSQIRQHLETILGPNSIFDDEDVLESFAVDETHERKHRPDLVVKPRSVDEIAALLRFCNDHDLPVTPRGGGSGVSGGALAVRGGVILCMERLNKIEEIDPADMTVTVETGAITGEVQELLLEQGLCLPPDPGSRTWCQVGGNLAEMAAGPKSVKYGAFKDYVLNLQVVLANGEVIWTGANVRKMACGYNLTQLMLGSEGTLGVITRVVFKVIPAPTEEIVLRLAFDDIKDAGQMISRVFTSGITPSEVEIMDKDAIEATAPKCAEQPDPETAAYLWIGFDGTREDHLMEDAERIAELAEELGAADALIATDPEQKRQLWEYRHKVGEAVIDRTEFRDVDISFPRSRLYEIVSGVKDIGDRYGFRSVIFGHCGDGNVHVQVLRDDMNEADWNGPVRAGIAEIYELAVSTGGAMSGEHGVGCTLTDHMEKAFGATVMNLMRGVKQVFDPKGILNPGKIIS